LYDAFFENGFNARGSNRSIDTFEAVVQAPALSSDGRYVAFASVRGDTVPPGQDTNDFCLNIGSPSTSCADIFVSDRFGGVELVSRSSTGEQGNNPSITPALSADGRYVAFVSGATNLVPGDTNGVFDVFVRDRQTGTTERISVASDGTQANGASLDRVLGMSAAGR